MSTNLEESMGENVQHAPMNISTPIVNASMESAMGSLESSTSSAVTTTSSDLDWLFNPVDPTYHDRNWPMWKEWLAPPPDGSDALVYCRACATTLKSQGGKIKANLDRHVMGSRHELAVVTMRNALNGDSEKPIKTRGKRMAATEEGATTNEQKDSQTGGVSTSEPPKHRKPGRPKIISKTEAVVNRKPGRPPKKAISPTKAGQSSSKATNSPKKSNVNGYISFNKRSRVIQKHLEPIRKRKYVRKVPYVKKAKVVVVQETPPVVVMPNTSASATIASASASNGGATNPKTEGETSNAFRPIMIPVRAKPSVASVSSINRATFNNTVSTPAAAVQCEDPNRSYLQNEKNVALKNELRELKDKYIAALEMNAHLSQRVQELSNENATYASALEAWETRYPEAETGPIQNGRLP